MAELEQQSACSEDTNSLCDEERVRKLFQACDGDGDGYIDRLVSDYVFECSLSSLCHTVTAACNLSDCNQIHLICSVI